MRFKETFNSVIAPMLCHMYVKKQTLIIASECANFVRGGGGVWVGVC